MNITNSLTYSLPPNVFPIILIYSIHSHPAVPSSPTPSTHYASAHMPNLAAFLPMPPIKSM